MKVHQPASGTSQLLELCIGCNEPMLCHQVAEEEAISVGGVMKDVRGNFRADSSVEVSKNTEKVVCRDVLQCVTQLLVEVFHDALFCTVGR